MISTIKFKAINHIGKTIYFREKYDHPDFEDYPINKLGDIDVSHIGVIRSKTSQVLEWLDNQDKTDLMNRRELSCIIDYEVYQPKAKEKGLSIIKGFDSKNTIDKQELIIKLFEEKNIKVPDQMVIDFVAVYTEMRESIKSLSINQQLSIVFKSMGVGYKTASNTLDQIDKNVRSQLEKWDNEKERLGRRLHPSDYKKLKQK